MGSLSSGELQISKGGGWGGGRNRITFFFYGNLKAMHFEVITYYIFILKQNKRSEQQKIIFGFV